MDPATANRVTILIAPGGGVGSVLVSYLDARQVEHYVAVYESIAGAESEIQAWCVEGTLPLPGTPPSATADTHSVMLEALTTTLGNIRSLKGAVALGVTTWDVWLAVVEDAIDRGTGSGRESRLNFTGIVD